ncbi:methyl-accepting chemotaxis protein [Lacibacterium aquatile]|uniref:Methyl-accepting chemotaxis protein n=1 Tax=Lacibacterium aquatile TaxID=1168082 RepID=A0ABW5DMS6_9PROT
MVNLRLMTKFLIVIASMSVIMAFLAWTGVSSMREYGRMVDESAKRSSQALIAERINGLVNAVVMDSRGVYMSKTPDEGARYAKGIEDQLKALQVQFAAWAPLVPTEEKPGFAKMEEAARGFITLRTELAALGRAADFEKANTVGNNDANRANRQAFNVELQKAVAYNNEKVQENEVALEAFFSTRLQFMLTICGVGILLGVGLGIWVGKVYIVGPVRHLTDAMTIIASGKTDFEVPNVGQKDEVGDMGRAVLVFRDGLLEAARLETEQQAEQNRKEKRQRTIEGHIAAFDATVAKALETLNGSATELQGTAHSMNRTADLTKDQATTVEHASGEASASVQTVAAATEELSSSIHEISRQVQESAGIAERATEEAGRTVKQVRQLAEAATRIGDVVRLINEIATQTNLLALNATIEAARAGDAGKGFAVVASEVKNLATQTAKATEEIASQVQAVQGETAEVVTAIEAIGGTIGKMNAITTAVAAAVEEQGAATGEIARNVQHAAVGTQQVSDSIGEVRHAANDTGLASGEVLNAATALASQGSRLRQDITDFLTKIRVA